MEATLFALLPFWFERINEKTSYVLRTRMNEQTAKAAFTRLKDRVLNQEVPRLKHKESAIVIAVITCFVPGLG